MAFELVGTLISQLIPYVQEEYATFKDVNKLAEKLSSNLTAIHAVLKDAEEKQITSHAVKDWLLKLTDAAHVLDDILDECSIVFEAYRDKYSIIHPKKLFARRNIGKKMKDVAERIDAIAKERLKFGLNPGTMEHGLVDDALRQTTSVVTEPQIHGRDEDRKKVVEFLLKHACDREQLSVYSIVGHGGYGKTALAQLVFNDERVTTHFPLKIWVCVSEDFNNMKLFQSIIESATGKNPDLSSLESMQKKVQEILQNERYLLVLDDVWSEDPEKWSRFKYQLQNGNGTKGASIIVTTRLETVANIVGTHPAHHLVGLSDDDTWSVFRQQAFGPNGEERAELVKIGKGIVKKCDGSPLAAKALGSLLRFKNDEHQWHSIEKSEIWKLYDDATKSALTLSYYNLKSSLRPCFSFCAVFPKDFEMVKEDLIHLWMANGFISSRGNLEVEHVGNDAWNELYQRSFFQEVKTGDKGKVTFKMHDIFHDIASDIMGEQCLASKAGSLTNLSKRVHHISCSNLDKQFKYNLIPFKRVESLRTVLQFFPPKSNLSVFPSVTPLRVLSTNCYQLSALKTFIHLRYFELYESNIVTLPESICSLRKLQTLKLIRCGKLISLPDQLTKLQDLRHVVIKQCDSFRSTPSNIGGLTHLRTLSIFSVGLEAGFSLAELHNLQLQGQLHIRDLQNVSNERDAREANLIGKKELSHLYLSWGGNANSQGNDIGASEQVLEALEPHTSLKYFGMKGYKGISIPNWMRNTSILEGLVDVILYNCRNCERLPPLGKLPCLTNLVVSRMLEVKYIDDNLYEGATKKAFPSLKRMMLEDLPKLERVLKAEGVEMLSQLSDLKINGIPKLEFPSLPSVETFTASWMTHDSNGDGASFLRGIAASMHNLKNLIIFNFPELKVLPNELNSLSSLQHLHILFCDKLESIPECLLQGLSSLESLGVGYCPNLILPATMNKLTSLRKVIICGEDKYGTLPNGLESIPSLQILELDGFPSLVTLPDWLGNMTSLQTLSLYGFPKLTSLPASFQGLINLHELSISKCPILVKRCKKETGEEWHKIAHVPKLELDSEPSFYEKMMSRVEKKMSKKFWGYNHYSLTVDYFDFMIDM